VGGHSAQKEGGTVPCGASRGGNFGKRTVWVLGTTIMTFDRGRFAYQKRGGPEIEQENKHWKREKKRDQGSSVKGGLGSGWGCKSIPLSKRSPGTLRKILRSAEGGAVGLRTGKAKRKTGRGVEKRSRQSQED